MLTETEIQDIFNSARPSIVDALKQEMQKDLTYEIKQRLYADVNKHVTEWVKENVLPELTIKLVEHKDSLIAIGSEIAPIMMQELTKAMTLHMQEKLKESYGRREMFKAIFGGY